MRTKRPELVLSSLTEHINDAVRSIEALCLAVSCSSALLIPAQNVSAAPVNNIPTYPGEYVITKRTSNTAPIGFSVSQLSDNSSSATNNLEQLGKYGRVVKRINRGTDLVVASDLTNKVTPGSPQVAALSNTEPDADFCKNLISAGLAETCTPNYKLSILQTSERDPLSSLLWGLGDGAGIAAESGWGISQGSRQVVVAVIDTGIDYTHEDLANNIWTNPFERPGNGLDDDGNGVIDDVHGARFISAGITGDPLDDNQHGTHVAGTIGAAHGNGLGVRGVAPFVTLLPIKFLDGNGSGRLSDAIAAIDYMIDLKIRLGVNIKIANNSWGGGGYSPALEAAIRRAYDAGIIFVAAAGNSGTDNDSSPTFPASYDLPNIISVAAIDQNQNLAPFSNYGAYSVDIAAPGVSITSTLPGQRYGALSGTSMATPHVSGALALLFAFQDGLSIESAITRTLETGRDSATLASPDGSIAYVKSKRILNVPRLLRNEITPVSDPKASLPACGYDFNLSNTTDSPGLDQAADLTNPVNQADEGDIREIALPFDFPFFLTSTRSIFISPNGLVYLSPPRGSDYQIASRAPNFSIAAFQSDLTPRNARQGARVYVAEDRAVIYWSSEMYAYPGLGPVTARLTLFRNGTIRSTVSFENSNDPDRLASLALGNGLISPASPPQGLIGASAGTTKQSSTLDIGDAQRKLASKGGSILNLAVTMVPNCFSVPTPVPNIPVPPAASPAPQPPTPQDPPTSPPPTDGGSLAKVSSIRMRYSTRERNISVRLRGSGTGAVVLRGAVNGTVCPQVITSDLSQGLGAFRLSSLPASARRVEVFNDDTGDAVSIRSSRRGRVRRLSQQRLCSGVFGL